MPVATFNVSMSEEMLSLLNREAQSPGYTSTSEVVREAIRDWLEKKIAADVAALEKAHAGAYERDTTPQEEKAILRIQRKVRGEMRAEREAKAAKGRSK